MQNGTVVADATCAGARPSATETEAQYGSCGYAASYWGSPTYSSSCSEVATKTETAQCQRSDGTIVPDAECTGRQIALTRTTTEANLSTCSYSWQAGDWSAASSACSANSTQARSVSCRRSDGTVFADSYCDPNARPEASQTVPDYSGCTYSWVPGPWSNWSSTCSSTAIRTRSVTCQRSDGTISIDGKCSDAKPITQDGPASNVTNCAAALLNGGFEGGVAPWSVSTGVAINTADNPANNQALHSGAASLRFFSAAATGTVSQSFQTTPGATYTVNWWVWQFSSNTIAARANGVQFGNAAGSSNSNGKWFNFFGSFVATGPSTTLTFAGQGSGTKMLDDVTATQVPN